MFMENKKDKLIFAIITIGFLFLFMIKIMAYFSPGSLFSEIRTASWYQIANWTFTALAVFYIIFHKQIWSTQNKQSVEHAAENGDSEAQVILCKQYMNGTDGREVNIQKGLYWLQQAVDQSNPEAIMLLGYCYQTGRGVKKVPYKAEQLFKTAAEAGNAYGCYYYALSLKDSRQHKQPDYEEAFMWMQKAVEQAYPPESFAELAAFYRYGMGTETNYFKAEECYRKGIRTRAWKFALTNYINMSEEIQSLIPCGKECIMKPVMVSMILRQNLIQ